MDEKLAETLTQGLTAYKRNNDLRIKAFQEYGTRGAWKVFLRVPVMLQLNISEVPGYVENENIPRGIHGYPYSDYIKAGPQLFSLNIKQFEKAVTVPRPAVESLLLMGSSGSVGHTASSDLDYWLCLNRKIFTEEQWAALREKTEKISSWAHKTHATEVNFFLIDIADLAANQLKPQGEETEGEVAPLLLKEEFYRTMLYVAGKAPLWTVLPPRADHQQYKWTNIKLQGGLITGYNPDFFLDLGFPGRPEPQEYLSAAMWLSEKSQADPFKAVLKMILILEQVELGFEPPLLCDLVKEQINKSSGLESLVDPYGLLIRQTLGYAQRRLPPDSLDLVRISAYLKIQGMLAPGRALPPDSPKSRLLAQLVSEWGWSEARASHLNDYAGWPDWERLQLGRELKNLLFSFFSKISNLLITEYPDRVTADGPGLIRLKAKLLARFSGHKSAVEDLPSHVDRRTMPQAMTLAARKVGWELFGGRVLVWTGETEHLGDRRIIRFTRVARAAAWLVHNQLYNEKFKLWLQPRPGPVSLGTMKELLNVMTALFPRPDYRQLESERVWLKEGRGAFLAILNLEEAWHETKLLTVDYVYRTVWGEMIHDFIRFRLEQDEAEKYLQAADRATRIGDVRAAGLHVFAPSGSFLAGAARNLKTALIQALTGRLPRPAGLTGLREGTQLDIDRRSLGDEEKRPFFLLADSDQAALERKRDSLADLGFTNCFLVPDGPSALAILDNFHIDVVLARQDLPGIGGLTLLKVINTREQFEFKAFVLEASNVTAKLVAQVGEAGRTHVIVAPYTDEALKNLVLNIFEEENDPQHAVFEKTFNQGSELMKAGRLDEALKTFESCLTIHENAEVYFNMGYLKTVQEEYPQALQCFRRAARINGNFARAFKQMAEVYEKMGNPEMSDRCLRKAADIYMERRQEEEAKEIYDQIIQVKPKTINVYNSLGILFRRRGKYPEAIAEFEKALKVNPNDENIYFNLSRALLDIREYGKAREALTRALALNSDFTSARELMRALEMGLA
ncbi:MAG: class I adenylate cyclase [Pseudomonadota bacterium]